MAVAVTVMGRGNRGQDDRVLGRSPLSVPPRSPAQEDYVSAPQAPAQGQAPHPQLGLTLEI